ncbi:phosphotransferase family protein [Coralliovum pocilloporae]|uniref:phosphotransferase family protein n=1 Tax=Coralliovum pocilloporae TaxID=3066369 RepID=UPI003306BA3C
MTEFDRQEAFSGTQDSPPALQLDHTGLCSYLADQLPEFSSVFRPDTLTIRQFKGGQSNPTYLLAHSEKSFVLRRKPPGPLLPSAHAVEREFRIIKALGSIGYPVPEAFHLCEDDTIIGSAFYLMEKVDGRIIWQPHIPGASVEERQAIFGAMIDGLARLHTIDPDRVGLGDFGKPRNYVARQIKRWSSQYTASETVSLPDMDWLIDWLPSAFPSDQASGQPGRIVHGDYRLDNLILHPVRSEIRAVLDWELSTLGDPIADFTYHLMQWYLPPSGNGQGVGSLLRDDLAALGIPDAERYCATYEEKTGFAVRGRLTVYLAYNMFRLAAIFQGIAGRVRDGTASSSNATAVASMVGPIAKAARKLVDG